MTFCEGNFHRRQTRGLYADDAHTRICFLHGTSNARDQPASADRSNDGFYVGNLVEYLEPHCALPRHHHHIVKRMDEGQSELLAAPDGLFARFVVISAV